MNLRDAQGIGEILLVGKHEENGITQFILLKLEGREEEGEGDKGKGGRREREEEGMREGGIRERGRRKE